MPYQKGQSGNPGGRKTDKRVTDALRKAAMEFVEGDPLSRTRLQKAADEIAMKAAEGDLACFNAIGDRLEGKPTQAVDQTIRDERQSPEEISDRELLDIATASGAGIAQKANGTKKPDRVH